MRSLCDGSLPPMPVPFSVRERIRSALDEDDEIRYVFPAEVVMSLKPNVFIAVSRKTIMVFSTGLWSKAPKSVLARMPRTTVLGPVDVQSTPYFTVAGIAYEIDEEYVATVNAADAEIISSPQDPLPCP